MQCPGNRIGFGGNNVACDVCWQPWLDQRGEAADQSDPGDARIQQTAHQGVDLACGTLHDAPRRRIAGFRMPRHSRCESGVVGRCRTVRPSHHFEWIMAELPDYLSGEIGRLFPSVDGAQRDAYRFQAKIGPAAFIRYRETVAPKPHFATVDKSEANAACADDNDAAVPPPVGPDTGYRGVIDKGYRLEWMPPCEKGLARSFTVYASDAYAGMHGTQPVRAAPGIRRGSAGGRLNCRT